MMDEGDFAARGDTLSTRALKHLRRCSRNTEWPARLITDSLAVTRAHLAASRV